MQRSKQQALMFLLGAVLVGGVLGFSADRVLTEQSKSWSNRQRMYADLDLSDAQRNMMDSLLDDRNCQIRVVMKPVRPQLDSIKAAAHQQVLQILTPEQQLRLEQRVQETARRDSARAATKTTHECK
jgi:hypothetical protein